MNEPTRHYASESRRWWRHERGSAAVEWAALAMVIATLFVMVAVGLRAQGQGIGQSIGDVILQAINGQNGAANVGQPNVGAPNVGQPNVGAIGPVTAPVVGIPSAFSPPQNSAPPPAEPESEDSGSGWLDGIQLALDGIGLIPVVGEVADLVNSGISAARGDWVGAGLSLAAMIPVGGQAATGAKWVRTGLEYSDEAAAALRGSDEAAAVVRGSDEVAAGADDVARRTNPCPLGAGFGPIPTGRAPTLALISLPRFAIGLAAPLLGCYDGPWPPQAPSGSKPAFGQPGAAEWRYQRYAYEQAQAGKSADEILDFDTWRSRYYTPAAEGGRPGRPGGPDQVATRQRLADEEGFINTETTQLGSLDGKQNFVDMYRPNDLGGTDFVEVDDILQSGIPRAEMRRKLQSELEALGPNDRLIYVDKTDPSRRIIYYPGDDPSIIDTRIVPPGE